MRVSLLDVAPPSSWLKKSLFLWHWFPHVDAEKVAQLRVQHMESLVSRLQKENRGMDEEFGRQRKKFMNQMMLTECKLKAP